MGSNLLGPNLEGHEGSHCKDPSNLDISDTSHRKNIGWYDVFADMDGNSDDSMTPTGDSPSLAVTLPSPHDISGSPAGKESYKAQRKNYRKEKKRVYRELLTTLQDKSIIILSDWLKVRGTLKGWTKLWCVLKPGMLILYKSEKTKSNHWVGTVLLNSCELIERPSKKNGFCFKIFHPLEQSIWATRGPENEAMRAVVQPLPTSSLIFRAPSQTAGKCWMDALELALRCSSLLKRSMSQRPPSSSTPKDPVQRYSSAGASASLNESDAENHFFDHDLDDNTSHTGREAGTLGDEEDHASLSDHDPDSESDDGFEEENHHDDELTNGGHPQQTEYSIHVEEDFDFGNVGSQTEELGEENKSLLWFLLKQVRPGMDLSKVVLPTFILEPRSFLDKLSDYYYHSDILSTAALCDDPLLRMCNIVKWYLSGFYKKPKGLKKPYNPILGETYRCYWLHPNNSRTFYIAEQVSHHPPLSAFYVSNRQDGFNITGSILAKSKFYGNSTSAIFEGEARLTLLPRGESYIITMPYAHAKGILMGTISMELGGKVSINCDKTGYSTEIDFKLKPLIGGSGQTNAVVGKIKLGKEVLYSIDGWWDSDIHITDKKTEIKETLWKPTLEIKNARLQKYTVPLDKQSPWESEKLWIKVSHAITSGDQVAATEEKTVLEERQRTAAKDRKASHLDWSPAYFQKDALTNEWLYKYADWRPWDQHNDVYEYEKDYVIKTLTRHRAPMIRTASLMSKDKALVVESLPARLSRSSNDKFRSNLFRHSPTRVSDSSTPDGHDDLFGSGEGGTTQVDGCLPRQSFLTGVMETMNRQNYEISNRLATIERQLTVIGGRLSVQQSETTDNSNVLFRTLSSGSLLHVLLVLSVAFAMQWFLQYVDHRRHPGGR